MLANEGVGFISGNYENLVRDVSALIENKDLRQKQGEAAAGLIEREFVKTRNVERLLTFANQLIR